jgi:hypothetical protein
VVNDLVSLGKRWGDHPWIPDLAGRLEQRIAAAAAGA